MHREHQQGVLTFTIKKSTDNGATWGSASQLNTSGTDDYRQIVTNFRSNQRLFAAWFDDDDEDLFGATIADIEPPAEPQEIYFEGVSLEGINIE